MQKSYQTNALKTLQTMDNRATTDRTPAGNSGLAKWRVTYLYDTFVVEQTVVLLMNFSAKNPPLRQAANRCASPNQIPVVMLKSFITVFISLVASIHSFGQFTFKGDSTDMRIQSGAMEEIDKKFSLRKDNEFELRLFIFPKWSDSKEGLSIFILSFKSGEWKARLFKNAWSPEQSQEFPLKSDGLDSLWKELDKNNVLTIPLAQSLVDKRGEILIDQLQGDNNSILYSFELLTKDAYRSYAYKCPLEFSRKYDYISTFKNVSNLVQLILQFCKIEKMSC